MTSGAVTARASQPTWTIAEVAEEFGVTHRTVRHYEDLGLISPERRGTQRVYSHADRARLAWILRGKRVGFSLAEIKEMIDLYDVGDGRRVQRQVTLERCLDRIQLLENQKHDIDAHIAELNQFVSLLKSGDDL